VAEAQPAFVAGEEGAAEAFRHALIDIASAASLLAESLEDGEEW
jgi:hypothetical protein